MQLFLGRYRADQRLCGPDVMKAELTAWQIAEIAHSEKKSLLLARRPAIPINQRHATHQPRSLST